MQVASQFLYNFEEQLSKKGTRAMARVAEPDGTVKATGLASTEHHYSASKPSLCKLAVRAI